jgi:hypothetical protein
MGGCGNCWKAEGGESRAKGSVGGTCGSGNESSVSQVVSHAGGYCRNSVLLGTIFFQPLSERFLFASCILDASEERAKWESEHGEERHRYKSQHCPRSLRRCVVGISALRIHAAEKRQPHP